MGESAAATAVTVTASMNNSPLPTATTVTVSRTGGTATPGTDYPAVTDFVITIPSGQTSGTATLSFDPTGDGLAEGGETVILTGSATGLTAGTATLTITDDDPAPTAVTLSLNPAAVGESATATAVTVTASLNNSPLPTATTVAVSRTGGTATSGTDYPAVTDFMVTIQAGQTSGTAQLSFDPSEDSLAEGDETVILTGSATGLTAGTATLTITDDDPAPTAVMLSLNPAAVGESAAATTVTVTASLNNSPLPTATTVTVSMTGGTATSGTDYPPVSDFTVTIPDGQTSGTATLSFDPTGDGLAEGDETVILTGSVAGLTAGAATLTITDDDAAPHRRFPFAQPGCRGRERCGYSGDGDRLAERLAAADGDDGDGQRDGGDCDLGDGLPAGERFHGDDPGWADQRDGDAVPRPERRQPGGGG